ncbi:MAG: 1-acyl-sn-glycerol-3-phosphate acyltransferase [Flavobacteriales bacterium]|nr:1-acyl-sn-glycerol-3-phosphate acyltransferase [Flavobacteriales bacterium]
MKYLLLPFQIIYTIYFLLLYAVGLTISFFGTLFLALLMGKKAHVTIYRFYKAWISVFFTISGVRMKIYGKEIRDNTPPCIIVSNHSTNIDMITAPFALPLGAKPLAKIELLKIPIIGYQFKIMSVMVDRKNKESRARSMLLLKKTLEEGFPIFIYPEGTRNRTETPLKEFYDGAFKIAIEMQKPILPLVTVNARNIWPMGSILIKPGLVKAFYLSPIDTKGMTEADVPIIKQQVYELMKECILKNDVTFAKKSIQSA